MKLGKRILLLVACAALLLIAWFTAATAKSDPAKQAELVAQAETYMADEVYVRAVPLLEEAAGYKGDLVDKSEKLLKECYLELAASGDYIRRYTKLLDAQMERESAAPEVFEEAALYYIGISKLEDALAILRSGIEKTNSEALTEIYENNRYAYKLNRNVYDDVGEIYGSGIQVKREGKWGIATTNGILSIPCAYDKISTWAGGQAIAMQDGTITAVDADNNRLALFHESATNFTNYGSNRLGVKLSDGWHLATGDFSLGTTVFEEMGMISDGAIPAKKDGKWGLVNASGGEWVIPNEYDGIVTDGLGRAYSRNAVFVRSGSSVKLLVEGAQVGEAYEDARPFADGFAAVKKNGKWGYIDTNGSVRIDFRFDDALSFGQHLAAVKVGESWGYIGISGEIVIEPVFAEAKSFSNGSAPIKTEDGWQFITLLEYI